MDRREAIQKIEAIIDNGQDYGYWTDAQRKAIDLAMEALGRTDTDCISRQQAIEAFCDDCRGLKPVQCEHWDKCKSQKVLRSLPPVTPTERTGVWIVYPLIDDGRVELECSECGDTFVRAVDYKPDFCENCGAKMGGDAE